MRKGQPSAVQVAFNFVLLIGVANLFADLTYEGARSINGQFLASLGASSLAVGFTAGAGELLGYGLRSITGLISDRTRQYWLVNAATYATILIEISYPFLIWQRRTRPHVLAAAMILHIMFAILLRMMM